MILIIGGAFSGKKDFAIQKFNLHEEDICNFENNKFSNIDELNKIIINKKCLYNIQCMIKNSIEKNISINDILNILDKNKIIISDDVSCGIVPLDVKDREFREKTSKFLTSVSKMADEVYRMFAGLPMKIK